MKRIVRKMAQRKIITVAFILMAVGAILGTYTLLMISHNVNQMAAAAKDEAYYFPAYPATNTLGKDPATIARGEYLAKAGDCIACHTNTPEKGQAFAGGLPMVTPFGTIYSPNITPDKETGIGNWTEDQFVQAMRKGISPQGHFYYPAFPYYYFNRISNEDLHAIKAYLDSLPPIHQVNRPAQMVPPFNERFLQFGWRMLFFRGEDTGPFKPDPKQSDIWNRGAYLVEGLGHCAMCHSPSYHIFSESLSLGAPIQKFNLSGAKIQGYLAPNISKKNLATVPVDEIIRVFTEDRLIGGGKVEGPMLEVNHDSLRNLTQSDLLAISTYLKTVVSQTPPVAKSSGGPGADIYGGYCAGCHNAGAGGAPRFGDKASWEPILKNPIGKVYSNAIHGINGMPAKGTCISCTDDQIKQAVDYMIAALSGGGAKMTITPEFQKPLSMQDGKRVYDQNCSVCHNSGFNGAPKINDKAAWPKILNNGFYDTYLNVVTGRKGHPVNGACTDCSDAQLKAAIKYMLQQNSGGKNYDLW